MKKRLCMLFSMIAVIVLITVVIGSRVHKDKSEFPHNKQIMLKSEGSMNVIKNKPFKIPFIFIDEYALSEMSSSDNIDKIEISVGDSRLKINKWTINTIMQHDKYIERCIEIDVEITQEGKYSLKELSILYNDNKTEKFDIGNINLICEKEDKYLDKAISMVFNIERQNNQNLSNKIPFSALGVSVQYCEPKDGILKGIDLGVENLGIDKNKFSVESVENNDNILNEITEIMNEKLGEKEIIIMDDLEKQIPQVKFSGVSDLENGNSKIPLLIVPITMNKPDDDYKVYILNIKMYVEVDGVEKICFKYEPTIIRPCITSEKKIARMLEEKGI